MVPDFIEHGAFEQLLKSRPDLHLLLVGMFEEGDPVPEDVVNRIKSHHDFPSGGNKAICALNELSNWNKHNLLIVALGETSFTGTIGGTSFEGNAFVGGIQNIIAWEGNDRDLEHSVNPTFQIVFGNHKFVKNQPLIPTLADFCVSSMDALQAFREVFPIPKAN